MTVVYHATRHRGLHQLAPKPSTHGQPWVYACKNRVMAALFLSGTGGDLTCAVGRDEGSGLPYLCERFAGAFEHRYAGAQGSIYVLPAESFLGGRTGWEEEVVSSRAVSPLEEIEIEDAAAYIRGLEEQGCVRIYFYPSRPRGIPVGDEDLVMRGIVWTREKGEAVLEAFARYHPHLVERIKQGLATGRYSDRLPWQSAARCIPLCAAAGGRTGVCCGRGFWESALPFDGRGCFCVRECRR